MALTILQRTARAGIALIVMSFVMGLTPIALPLLAFFQSAFSKPAFVIQPALAAPAKHGLSAFGDLKYPADFKHFDYVNPNAPKGGRLATIGTTGVNTFNSFNAYIVHGDPAAGLQYLFDTLMTRAYDEPDALYGLVAKTAEVADDKMSVTFKLRKAARFADGSPLTAQDVVFSFNLLKEKGHPNYRLLLRDVKAAEAPDAQTVRYSFQGESVRDLPLIVASLPIFSKAFYRKHDFTKSSLIPPLGSGPYKIAKFKPGTFITYQRRKDYWAKDLPVNVGRFNFDELRYEYYKDRAPELEALKAGNYDLREEFTSRDWAKSYNIPQVKSGRLIRKVLPDLRPSGAQGYFINTRRAKFADRRVRKALDYAFDFEWTNRTLFHNSYIRTASFFENSKMKASGPPSKAELALLEPYRDQLPKEVFEAPYVPPKTDGSGRNRRNLLIASKLLESAGWVIKNGRRVNAKGEPLTIEFLSLSRTGERIAIPYAQNLKFLGIQATVRRVDPAQYERRIKSFDFDIVGARQVLPMTPGVEMRNLWSSQAARAKGSRNLAGIANPVIDALIERAVRAKTRDELYTVCRAIDRVLRAGHYWVPHWYKASHWVAFWNKFSWPAIKPAYARGIIDTWWYDADKAAKLGQ